MPIRRSPEASPAVSSASAACGSVPSLRVTVDSSGGHTIAPADHVATSPAAAAPATHASAMPPLDFRHRRVWA